MSVWVWMALAVAAESGLALATLAAFGAGQRGTDIALQLTARLSFLLFLPAYAGGAAARLLGPRWQGLRRHGRVFGLAFASAHLAHLALVAWLCWVGATPAPGVFVLFGVAAFWTYLLALLSVGDLQRALGADAWRLARLVGMNYIMFTFATDFLGHRPAGGKYLLAYGPFVILTLAAPAACLLAFLAPHALPHRGQGLSTPAGGDASQV